MNNDQNASSNIPDFTEENIKQLEEEYSQISNASFKESADALLNELKTALESAQSSFEVSQANAEIMSRLYQLQSSHQWSSESERVGDFPKAMALFTGLAQFRQQEFGS